MSKNNLILKYQDELERIRKEKNSLDEIQPEVQIKIDQIKPPIAQLDEEIAELTIQVNQKIQEMSLVAMESTNCGCGTYITDENDNQISIGTTYYYEHAKTLRMSAEDTNYTGNNPFSPLSGTDGSTSFNSGIGASTIIVGATSNSILELLITNGGTGYASTLSPYYFRSAIGGSGSAAKIDIIVGTSGSVSQVSISNGGTGYKVGESISFADFPTASFVISDVGSPILGVGTQTYIVSSSGIGSVFVPGIDVTQISTCGVGSACGDFASEINRLNSDITSLRSQRQILLDGVNYLKQESERFFLHRFAYCFARGQLNIRIFKINKIISIYSDNTFDNYFS